MLDGPGAGPALLSAWVSHHGGGGRHCDRADGRGVGWTVLAVSAVLPAACLLLCWQFICLEERPAQVSINEH